MSKSPLLIHMDKWKDGCGADICERSQRVCHIRGDVPCDVVFIGEAPGDSEDVLGIPFTGPAGVHFQRYVIQRAIPHKKIKNPKTNEDRWVPNLDNGGVKYALMNLAGCIPRDETHTKEGPPDVDVIRKCAPRLLELLNICKPRLIICVGKEAEVAMDPWMKSSVLLVDKSGQKFLKIPRVTILHPAFILRMNENNRGLAFQRTALTVEQAIDEYVLNPGDHPKGLPDPNNEPPGDSHGSGLLDDPNDPIPF